MKKRHERYRRMLPRYLYGELTEMESKELEEHLRSCEQCQDELRATRKLHTVLAQVPLAHASETVLTEARAQSRAALSHEQRRASLWQTVHDAFALPVVARPAIAVAAVILVLTGFFGARIAGLAGDGGSATAPMLAEGARIANVRFIGGGKVPGDVEVLFDAVRPVRLRGTVDDPIIRKVLAYALMSEDNPGVRLRAAGFVASTPVMAGEPEVKAALLLALRSDSNAGVRKEALKAVLRYPPDQELRDALLQVLLRDTNPGLRIAAINALDTLRARGYAPDAQTQEMLRDRIQHDNNLFIRVKSRTLLEERPQ